MMDVWNRGSGTSRLVQLAREGRRLTGEQSEALWEAGYCHWCGGALSAQDVEEFRHEGCRGRKPWPGGA